MSAAIIMPVSADGQRARLASWCMDQYFPHSVYIAADPEPERVWSKGRAVNAAMRRLSPDVDRIAIVDCDLVLGVSIECAFDLLTGGAPWVMPHSTVFRLTRELTERLLARRWQPADGISLMPGRRHRGPVGGGAVVLRRADFEEVRGIDPRFEGWGGEDISFGRALDTLVGEHVRIEANCWHLWHEPMERHPGRRASPANEELANAYLDAYERPSAMRELIESR